MKPCLIPMNRLLPRALACLAAAASVGCSDVTGPPASTPNFIRLVSDAGDFIGAGATYDYTQANAILGVTASGGRLTIRVEGDETWTGEFVAPTSQSQLQPGTHAALERYPFHVPANGGLSWSGDGRGCNTLTGSFTIDQVTYVSGSLTAIDLRFEQHCEKGNAALRGTIHWDVEDATVPPGPVAPPPANLWRPAPGVTPATGSYVYIESTTGDFIGGGLTKSYTQANAQLVLSALGGRLSVNVTGSEEWFGEFETMSSAVNLQPGYYPSLRRWPFHNRARGGLTWFGQGRGCNTLRGWFVIDSLTRVNGTITAFDLRFEQFCENSLHPLHGAIHWTG